MSSDVEGRIHNLLDITNIQSNDYILITQETIVPGTNVNVSTGSATKFTSGLSYTDPSSGFLFDNASKLNQGLLSTNLKI